MTQPLPLNLAHPALLIMDYQVTIISMNAAGSEEALKRTAAVLAAARSAGIPVIYVRVAFRPGYPEISPRNERFSALKQSGRLLLDDPDSGIHSAVKPQDGEPVVVKKRVSAFAGSDLEVILRAQGIETLILAGISTSGVVLSTVRQAMDLDYRLIVLKDCCLDRDEEVHRCLTEKIFPPYATVLTAEEILPALRMRAKA